MALLIVGTSRSGEGTTAYLSSTLVGAPSVFTAGTIELGSIPASTLLTFSGAYPGATIYGGATVANSGTNSLRYSIADRLETVTADSTQVGNEMQITVRAGGEGNPGVVCDETAFSSSLTAHGAAGFDYETGPLALVPADGKVLGDWQSGSQTGDRLLEPGTSELVCFKVQLPTTAPASVQAKSATVVFTFFAEQAAGT